jgi:N utilization substance protein A
LPEAAGDSLAKVKTDGTLVALLESEGENISRMEELLSRKADGRPLTPEEYDFMAKFVDRIERKATTKTAEQKKAEEDRFAELKKGIPVSAFTTNILDSGLPEHVAYILQEAGFATAGELAIQMKVDSDNILRLQGLGPRAMESINTLMASLEQKLEEEKAAAELAAATKVEAPAVVEVPSVVETAPVVEETIEAAPGEAEVEVEEVREPEPEPSLEELFTLRPEVLDNVASEEEDEESKDKKKGKKKGKHVEVTYDPDRDVTIARKKHKRGDGDGWDWES